MLMNDCLVAGQCSKVWKSPSYEEKIFSLNTATNMYSCVNQHLEIHTISTLLSTMLSIHLHLSLKFEGKGNLVPTLFKHIGTKSLTHLRRVQIPKYKICIRPLKNLIFFPVFSLERTHKKHLVNQKKSNKEGKII
jgi:hypothetical protein